MVYYIYGPFTCRHGLLESKKTVQYHLRSLRTLQNLFDRMKNCIERVERSSGFAVIDQEIGLLWRNVKYHVRREEGL